MKDLSLGGMLSEARHGTEGGDSLNCRVQSNPSNRQLVIRYFNSGLREMLDTALGRPDDTEERCDSEELKKQKTWRGWGIGDMLEDAVAGSR